MAMVTDDITATIATSIDKALFNTTKYDNHGQVDAEKIAQTIKSILKITSIKTFVLMVNLIKNERFFLFSIEK